jgi:NDP-sugar pyrophosphorylase family protein
MKAVILAGGIGARLSEETVNRPKPMIEIGGKPYSMAHFKNARASPECRTLEGDVS